MGVPETLPIQAIFRKCSIDLKMAVIMNTVCKFWKSACVCEMTGIYSIFMKPTVLTQPLTHPGCNWLPPELYTHLPTQGMRPAWGPSQHCCNVRTTILLGMKMPSFSTFGLLTILLYVPHCVMPILASHCHATYPHTCLMASPSSYLSFLSLLSFATPFIFVIGMVIACSLSLSYTTNRH